MSPTTTTTTTVEGTAAADQVRSTLHAYCRCLDGFDLDALLDEVYAPDVVDDRHHGAPLSGHQDVLQGHEDIRRYFTRAFESVEALAHMLTNVDVYVDGDRADASSRVLAFHWLRSTSDQGPTRPADFVMMGTYDDELRRTPDGWRITRRDVSMLGLSGLALGTFPAALA
jgi:ketosteroid isomerase-like protein